MRPFPVFLDLSGRPCLVVGGGAVGCRKARGLLEAGARVLVVDPSPGDAVRGLMTQVSGLELRERPFEAGDCEGRFLIYACTPSPEVNESVAAAASRHGALCSRADGGGDFSGAALLRRGPLCLAVSSGGLSPVLAALARDRAASAIGDEFAEAAQLLGELRERVLAEGSDRDAGDALGPATAAAVVEALGAGRREEARRLVEEAWGRVRASASSDGPAPGDTPCTR
ncbi:MAG: bifunctional precorrin-2 dehydrogenase/sirohydrochlorin ferrochelatase [Candidatus Binatia bacterium]